MTKILYFITQAEFGGAQRYVFDLAHNLKDEFQVAVALGEQGKDGKLAKILAENNIPYYIIPHLKRGISPLNEILALREISKLIKQCRPDIIHLNSSKISIIGSIASLFVKTKVVYTAHGWVFNEPLPFFIKWFYLWAEKFTARFKDKIICISEYDRQIALRRNLAPAKKLIVVHNGLTPVDFYSKEEARKILQIPASDFLIGSIGNLYKTKGFKYLIEAARILISNFHLPLTFVVIGKGKERKNLENLIKKYNLQNNFILTGAIDDAAKLLKAFDVYVCSSVKEGFPYSILEAMSAGLPIAASEVNGIPEMLEHKKTSLLAKPADARDLAEKIKMLINDKTLSGRLDRQAKSKVEQEFSLEKMVERTKNLYNSL